MSGDQLPSTFWVEKDTTYDDDDDDESCNKE